ncbi:hypothetical protein OAG71_00055 [bacterium]|nr:hypothetical protein [bacterium]
MSKHSIFGFPFLVVLSLLSATSARADNTDVFSCQVQGEGTLDRAAFAQSVDGVETPAETEKKGGARDVLWTRKTVPQFGGVKFGAGRSVGKRHLRIGFTDKVSIGSVLVRGGGTLSVLKKGAKYPGDLTDDSQWTSAERLVDGQPTTDEVDWEGYALWLLPPNTQTRALRFTHSPNPRDPVLAGRLGGAWILKQRLGNIAPQALVQSVARDDKSAKLVDRSNNKLWKTWDNGKDGAVVSVDAEHPEFITLTWPRPVSLDGLCLLWTGFADADVETFVGDDTENIREAANSNWRRIASVESLKMKYTLPLGPDWIAFEKTILTRAVRLRIKKAATSRHPHTTGKMKDGRRVWLGELMAITSLSTDATLESLVIPKEVDAPPPIPVKFTLPEAGLVTLVIEDQQGRRVRNLVSETPFPAGENIAWWDGSDDLLRDRSAAQHGVYHIPTRPVDPGNYKVRGLWHQPLKLRYEFSIYSAGKPAWQTKDNTGCWLATHSPPTSVAVVPGARTRDGMPLVFLGTYLSEGGHGLQWLREDGEKIGGQGSVGGNWYGAPTIAVDLGPKADADHLCYAGSIANNELRLTAKTKSLRDRPIAKLKLGNVPDRKRKDKDAVGPPRLEGFDGGDKKFVLGAIAAHDGKLVCSLVRKNQLLVVDIKTGEIEKKIEVTDPRGLWFAADGRLLVLAGRTLSQLSLQSEQFVPLISAGLEDPRHVTMDASGNILITDRGTSHQVKVFSPAGKLISTIGKPGEPSIGPYDPLYLNSPNGLAVDTQGRVWVAEADNSPRRVSLWSPNGELIRAFYGPTEYGGGGTLDPMDSSRFFYKGLEFKLDWKAGTDRLVRIYSRPDPLLQERKNNYSPDTPLYPSGSSGRRYFTSCYTTSPTSGDHLAFVWLDGQRQAQLVAAVGNARAWPVLRETEFRKHWPSGTKPEEYRVPRESLVTFSWTDANRDGRPQPTEVQFAKVRSRGVTVMNDLSFVFSQYDGRNVRIAANIDAAGLPRYDVSQPQDLGPAGGRPPSTGGNQSLTESSGWAINLNAPEPFSPFGIGGTFQGEPRWSYPSVWPGLHASHEAAVPDRPGMIVGHTRLIGGWVDGKAGPMFGINGNMGNMYLMTADGMFVSTLFHDIRTRPNWASPVAIRNMDVTDVSLHDENFWPSITQTTDGRIFLVDGGRTSLVRVEGLETLQRLPDSSITVTAADLRKSREWFTKAEAKRQRQLGPGILTVPLRSTAPQVDGQLGDWPLDTDWAFVDRRGVKANFDSRSRPYQVSAAVTLTNTHLYAAWKTTETNLLNNSGETANGLFKHGGCLDIMLGSDPNAPIDRKKPAAGDQRLLITRVKDKTVATLYRAKVPGTKTPVAFSSPWRSIYIDAVEDVSQQVSVATDKEGNYEISIPLAALHWRPKPGATYRADIGVLRGANGQTTQRVYWANKATAITADVPSEAELTPGLWGKWKIKAEN